MKHWQIFVALAALASVIGPAAARDERADIALVLAVDVSGSVDGKRYVLQMEGIAAALETPEVEHAILGGAHQSMEVILVEWSTKSNVTIPWTLLSSPADIAQFAAKIRAAPRNGDQFTCMSVAMRQIADKLLAQMPVPADRVVIDVSGDGHDNCNPAKPVETVGAELAASGAIVNGLPILEGDEATTLEAWYTNHVIAGAGAFVLPAAGFNDIANAMRHKFVTEISSAEPPPIDLNQGDR